TGHRSGRNNAELPRGSTFAVQKRPKPQLIGRKIIYAGLVTLLPVDIAPQQSARDTQRAIFPLDVEIQMATSGFLFLFPMPFGKSSYWRSWNRQKIPFARQRRYYST